MRSPLLPALALGSLVALWGAEARADDDEAIKPLASATPTASGSGMQSPAAFGTGLVLSTVGAAGIATGAYLWSGGHAACDGLDARAMPTDEEVGACTSQVIRQVGGVVGLVSGGAFFIAGIPAIAVGASSAGPSDEAKGEPSDAPRAAVLVSPTHVDLVVSF